MICLSASTHCSLQKLMSFLKLSEKSICYNFLKKIFIFWKKYGYCKVFESKNLTTTENRKMEMPDLKMRIE